MTKETRIELPPGFETPRDGRGRIQWTPLSRDPLLLKGVIQAEAQVFYESVGVLNQKSLKDNKARPLLRAIQHMYPGRLTQLQKDLDITTTRTPRGYWTNERIVEEARRFLEKEGQLTRDQLRERKRADLENALRKYPGGWRAVRKQIGEQSSRKQRGYWQSQDNIRQEAQSILAAHGDLSSELVNGVGNPSLNVAINKNYPGGWEKLREDLGLQATRKRPGFWTSGRIEQEAITFFQEKGELNVAALLASNRNDLVLAVNRNYPGKMAALLEKVGGEPRVKRGYWTPELIEQEATAFLAEHGVITYDLLLKQGRRDLHSAVAGLYPGKISGLKVKLGLKKRAT